MNMGTTVKFILVLSLWYRLHCARTDRSLSREHSWIKTANNVQHEIDDLAFFDSPLNVEEEHPLNIQQVKLRGKKVPDRGPIPIITGFTVEPPLLHSILKPLYEAFWDIDVQYERLLSDNSKGSADRWIRKGLGIW
jgi:hypothetical protein